MEGGRGVGVWKVRRFLKSAMRASCCVLLPQPLLLLQLLLLLLLLLLPIQAT